MTDGEGEGEVGGYGNSSTHTGPNQCMGFRYVLRGRRTEPLVDARSPGVARMETIAHYRGSTTAHQRTWRSMVAALSADSCSAMIPGFTWCNLSLEAKKAGR